MFFQITIWKFITCVLRSTSSRVSYRPLLLRSITATTIFLNFSLSNDISSAFYILITLISFLFYLPTLPGPSSEWFWVQPLVTFPKKTQYTMHLVIRVLRNVTGKPQVASIHKKRFFNSIPQILQFQLKVLLQCNIRSSNAYFVLCIFILCTLQTWNSVFTLVVQKY